MAYPRDTTGYVYAPGQEPDVVVENGAISITPPSARSQPRSPQGQKLVDEYALRFSDTTGGAAARAFKSPTDFFDPQKREAALTEAKAEPGFRAGKRRALQGGVGLPVHDKPGAGLRAGLPSGAEPWATEKAPPGVAPVIAAPIREDADTDYEVRKDIIEMYSPVPREAIGRPGFGSVAGFTRGGNAELEPLEGMSPEQADVEWADRAIAKPTQFGTLSKPTVTEQVAMFPFGLGAGLAEKTLETVGLDSPERAIPLGGGGIYGYETGRDAPEVAARLPAAFLKGAASRIGAGYDAAMNTPMTSGDGFWGYVEDMANATGNALEAMTGVPKSSFEWDTSDYYERAEDDPEVVAARTEEEQAAVDERRDVGEKKYRERQVAKDIDMMPTLGALTDDVRRVAEAAIMVPIEAVTATGDPTLTAQERANRLGTLGSDLVMGGAGSAIRTVASPRESWTKTPVEHLFNIGMLMRGAGLTPTAPPKPSPQEAWKRVDLEEMVGEREKAYGFEKATAEGLRIAKEINDDLELSGFFRSPEARAAVDSRVVLAEAQRRLADTEALIERTQTARPVVGDVLFEGATKSEKAVPAAQDAVKGERAGLSDAARAAADAETLAMQRVAAAQQALKDHMGGRPLGDWADVTREAFKAKAAKTASAARPTTKNRPFGEATVSARDRHEKAQLKLREFKPWVDEFKRLKREVKKTGEEAAKAREAARKARQDDGKLDELTQAEQDARIGREAVREAGTAARKSLPKVSELQEAAKKAREAVKAAKADSDAAAAAAGAKIPSALSRHVGTLELERAALRKRVANAGQEVAVAEEAIRAARAKYDAEFAQAEAALNAAEQKKAGAEAGARPPGVREAGKAAALFKAERARARAELEAAKAEEAAALDVLKAEQAGAVDAFGAAQRARQEAAQESLDGWFDDGPATPASKTEPSAATTPTAASDAKPVQAAAEATPDLALEFAKKAVASAKTPEEASLAAAALERARSRSEVLGESWLDDAEDLVDGTPEFAKEQVAYAEQQVAVVDGFITETQRKLDRARAKNAASPTKQGADTVSKYESRIEELARIKGEVAKAIEAGKKDATSAGVAAARSMGLPAIGEAVKPVAAGSSVIPAASEQGSLNRAVQARAAVTPPPESASAAGATAESIAKLRELRDAYDQARMARTTAEGVTRQFAQDQVASDYKRFTINKDPAAAAADVARTKAIEKAAKAQHDQYARSIGEPVIGAKPPPQPKDTRPKHVQEMESSKAQYDRANGWLREIESEIAMGGAFDPMTGGRDLAAAENLRRVAEDQIANAKRDYDRLAKKHGLPKLEEARQPVVKPSIRAASAPTEPPMARPNALPPEGALPRAPETPPDAFGALKRERQRQYDEARDLAAHGKALTPDQMKAEPLNYDSAAEWAQAAREAVAEAQARFDEVAAGESVAKTQADLAKYANLPPAFREKIIGLEDRVRTLGEAVKSAREQAAAASDPMVDNLRRYVEKDYAQAKAQLAEAQSLVRRNESQRQQSVRNSDAAATAVRNRMALRRRQHERVLMKLTADRNVAQRRLRSLTDDLAKVADPLKEAVERGTAAAEGLKAWVADKEPAFQEAVRELNKLEDDFARSESKLFWTEQLVRMAPKHVATMGASLVYEVAKRLASQWLDTKGREWLKYALKTKDARISQAFDSILENAAGRAEIMKMGLEEAFRRIPKEHRPTVAKWLDMEHSLAEGGWWRAGNYNFKAGEAPGHLSKFDPETGKWSITKAGEEHIAEAMAQAQRFPEGSPEWADAINEVQRFNTEMEVANTWGSALAMQLKAVEAEAAAAGLPRDPESLRPVWLPQVLTEAAQKKARQKTMGERAAAADAKAKVAARADAFTDSKPGSKPVPREQDAPMVQPDMKEYESSMLRKTRVPMTERELRYGMETDLGKRVSAVGRLVWDVQLRTIYNHIGDTMALTDEAKKLKRAVPEAQQAARGTGDRRSVEAFDRSWKKLEDDPKYGTAAGKWIPADVYFELANMENLAREAQGIVNRAMSKWKEWQVTGNPTTLNRNIGVNALVFAPAAGISLLNPRNLPLYSEVVADLMRSFDQRDPLHREMVANNSLDNGMMKSELMREVGDQYLGAFQRGGVEPMKAFLEMMYEGPRAAWKVTANPAKALSESAANKRWFKEYDNPSLTSDQRLELLKTRPKPGVLADATRGADAAYAAGGKALDAPFAAMREYHRFGDQVFKEVFYRKRRREGASPEQAKRELDQHFPKYNTVPGFAHVVKAPHSIIGPNGKPITGLRGVNFVFSVPFVAYTATSIPIFMKWAKENPAQGAAYMAFHNALTGMNLAEAGLTKEQADAIEKAMPAYRRTSERLVARFAPKLAKTSNGDWRTVNTQFANPAAEFVIPQDDTVSGTENIISATKSASGFMEWPFLAPLIGVLGKDITQPTAPDIWEPGDPDVAERIFNYSMKKLAHPLAPSISSIASGDLGYGENRGQPGRLEGGKITQGLEMSRGGAPNRLGRRVSEDDFAASLMGLKTGYTSEDESARSISEQIKDRFVRAERAAVAATSQQQLRMNELKKRDPAAFAAAQRRIVSQVLPFISQSVDRLRALSGDPVVAEYLDNYAPVIEAWNAYNAVPSDRQTYEQDAAWDARNGYAAVPFDEWVRANQAALINKAYKKLRAATGAGTRETGDARREMRTGESQ